MKKHQLIKKINSFIILLLLGLCLLGCNNQPSKQDKSIQPVIQKDDKFTNHYELPLTESEKREVLHYADSVLQVKGIKLVDYRNEIYQYGDTFLLEQEI